MRGSSHQKFNMQHTQNYLNIKNYLKVRNFKSRKVPKSPHFHDNAPTLVTREVLADQGEYPVVKMRNRALLFVCAHQLFLVYLFPVLHAITFSRPMAERTVTKTSSPSSNLALISSASLSSPAFKSSLHSPESSIKLSP